LAVLRDKQVRAAFFIVGDWAEQHPELMKQIAAEGHWLGNHTKTHANLVALSDEAVRVEVLGGPHATLLRPPYGAYDGRVRRLARELGYALAFWTLDTKDWTGLGASAMTDRVAGSIDRGGCVLMHLNAPHTLAALPGIIEAIRARGLELCHEGNEIVL
jgi:peptidoglycan/xylan/chitin deacetylase (PgdA/CDA1 family)